nr:IS66 family transposase [Bradyrhizobium sp. 35]
MVSERRVQPVLVIDLCNKAIDAAAGGEIQLAFCPAHARCKFVEVFKTTQSPFAREVIERLQAVYAIAAEIARVERRAAARRPPRQGRSVHGGARGTVDHNGRPALLPVEAGGGHQLFAQSGRTRSHQLHDLLAWNKAAHPRAA